MVAPADRIRLGASQLTRSVTMKRRLATFSSLVAAGAYALTLLAGQPVASADSSSGGLTAASSAMPLVATNALCDGDDVRARFILALQSDQLEQSALVPSVSLATAALADSDDVRARFILSLQH
jgi:hypothetical protein